MNSKAILKPMTRTYSRKMLCMNMDHKLLVSIPEPSWPSVTMCSVIQLMICHLVQTNNPLVVAGFFAGLNAMRLPLKKNKKLTEFEFSQNYLFFWHKIETSNNFLHTIYKIYKASPDEKPEGRLLSTLLCNPCSDGGNWKCFSNLVAKYGVMPKECFPDNDSCRFSDNMNDILKSKLQQFAFELSKVVEVMTEEEIETRIKAYMNTIYQIVGICLGIPPDTFTWRFKDEDKNQPQQYSRTVATTATN